MPITSSAIKAARQALARRERRQAFRTRTKTAIRTFTDLVAEKKMDEAKKLLPAVYKAIDAATKKHILHPNTASRRKSRMAKMVN